MQSLRVRLLGELQVEGCDRATLGRRQQRTLLKILALHHGRPVSVDHLTECLWGDGAPARASEQLSVLASRLRSVVGAERIERTDAGYKLTLDWLDLDALGEYATEAERRLAQDALVAGADRRRSRRRLARGRLLADEPDPWWAAPECRAWPSSGCGGCATPCSRRACARRTSWKRSTRRGRCWLPIRTTRSPCGP